MQRNVRHASGLLFDQCDGSCGGSPEQGARQRSSSQGFALRFPAPEQKAGEDEGADDTPEHIETAVPDINDAQKIILVMLEVTDNETDPGTEHRYHEDIGHRSGYGHPIFAAQHPSNQQSQAEGDDQEQVVDGQAQWADTDAHSFNSILASGDQNTLT